MTPELRKKLIRLIKLAIFAGIFCLMVFGLYRLAAAFAVAVLEIH